MRRGTYMSKQHATKRTHHKTSRKNDKRVDQLRHGICWREKIIANMGSQKRKDPKIVPGVSNAHANT